MTITQAERFYDQDTKEYELKNNKEFLKWLKKLITSGYHCYIDIEELQELIDNIVNWYEIKYPERELEYFEGIINTDFQDIKRISNVMDIRQLLYRLPHNQLCLMNCGYRAKGGGQYPLYENGKEIGWQTVIFMCINKKGKEEDIHNWVKIPYFLLIANDITGEVEKNYELKKYVDSEKNLKLDDVLLVFNEKYNDKLDFTELKECIFNHNYDIELRNKILQLVALKLLYSKNTIPERGYERAKRFINEFNKKLGLTLSSNQIDEIIHGDYTNGERWEPIVKTYIDKKGDKHSYLTVENVAKKDQSRVRKLRKQPNNN